MGPQEISDFAGEAMEKQLCISHDIALQVVLEPEKFWGKFRREVKGMPEKPMLEY